MHKTIEKLSDIGRCPYGISISLPATSAVTKNFLKGKKRMTGLPLYPDDGYSLLARRLIEINKGNATSDSVARQLERTAAFEHTDVNP